MTKFKLGRIAAIGRDAPQEQRKHSRALKPPFIGS